MCHHRMGCREEYRGKAAQTAPGTLQPSRSVIAYPTNAAESGTDDDQTGQRLLDRILPNPVRGHDVQLSGAKKLLRL